MALYVNDMYHIFRYLVPLNDGTFFVYASSLNSALSGIPVAHLVPNVKLIEAHDVCSESARRSFKTRKTSIFTNISLAHQVLGHYHFLVDGVAAGTTPSTNSPAEAFDLYRTPCPSCCWEDPIVASRRVP
nr:hypothetical protein CFP56_09880 [Quercus suber]